jgi:hypothetical protein
MAVVLEHECDLLAIWLPLVTELFMDGENASPENNVSPSVLPSGPFCHRASAAQQTIELRDINRFRR